MKKIVKETALELFTKASKKFAIQTVNSTCSMIWHQPKIPAELLRYKK